MVAPIAYEPETIQEALGQALVRALPAGAPRRRILAYSTSGGRIVVHDGYRVYHVRSEYQRLNQRLLETLANSSVGERAGLVVDPETGSSTLLPMSQGYAMICTQALSA
jgi:hypothetical protein